MDFFLLIVLKSTPNSKLTVCFPFNRLYSILHGWVIPARNAMIPRIVNQDQFAKANSILSTSDQVVLLAGWSLGGILVSFIGEMNTIWITLIILVISTGSLFLVKDPTDDTPATDQNQQQNGKWKTMKQGWLTIWRRPTLRIVTIMDVLETFGSSVWAGAFILVFVKQILHRGEEWWGILNGGYFAGTILGGLLIMYLSKKIDKNIFSSMFFGSLFVCIITLIFTFANHPIAAVIFVLLMGPFYQLRDVAQRTLFQNSVSNELLPKVLASQGTIIFITFGISLPVMGFVADHYGIKIIYFIAALVYTSSSLLAFLLKKHSISPHDNNE